MSSTPYTIIPPSQPSCGQPSPQCPNSTTTTTTTNPGEPMGCFLQTNGLFCAPISTTRGFLFSLDSPPQQQQQQLPRGERPFLVPRLSTANSNNNNATLVGVDGRQVNYQGPARLGETCYSIPLPLTTDALFQTLVTIANQRLNETLGGGTEATPTPAPGGREGYRSPGVGAGVQVFNFRGDCGQGSYCDFIPSTAAGSGGVGVVVAGTCKEVLPNFHNCTSYAQCSSLRCDHPWIDGGGGPRNSTAGNTVCLPSKLDRGNINTGGGGPGGGGGGGDNHFKFPAWVGGIIAIVVVFGAAIAFGLVRRRKKLAADKERKTLKQRRRSARSQVAAAAAVVVSSERERRKSMSLPLHSQQLDQENHHFGDVDDDKESDYVYQLHSTEPSLIVNEKQGLSVPERGSGGGGFGRWFRRSRTEDQMDRELGGKESMATGRSQSSVRSSLSLDQDVDKNLQYRDGQQSGSPLIEGHGVPLSAPGAALVAVVAGEMSAESIHSDSTTAVVLGSIANPRSRLSVSRPWIVTTPPDSASVPGADGEGEERDIVSTGLSYHHNNNLSNQPSFSSATSSSLNGSGASPPSPPSSDLSRRSSNHALLATTSTPPPGSPVSPISPISPRPPLSSGPSSRSSQRQSFQQQQQASPRRT